MLALAAVILLIPTWLAARIWSFGRRRCSNSADAAIVLGASVWGREPSPVFKERIDEGVRRLACGDARVLLLTGGRADRWGEAESIVARRHALGMGVQEEKIVCETHSRTTYENLRNARELMKASGLSTALVISDPLHMLRAMRMAKDLGIDALPCPTSTSRYVSLRTRLPFLLRETKSYILYLWLGY